MERVVESSQQGMFPAGRLAGVDYGTVRIGVAVTDARRTLASPYTIYQRRDAAADARFFRSLAETERLVGFVVGLPVHLDGRESQKSREARQFGAWLTETTGKPVVFFDERFTTAEADRFLAAAELTKKQRKARRDKLAAQILLAAYLESSRTGDPGPIDDDG
jgi:putative Holliday junction resolvase